MAPLIAAVVFLVLFALFCIAPTVLMNRKQEAGE